MKRPLVNKLAIVGVGLIGGSVGMAAKKRRLARLVVGVVRKEATIAPAFEKKALDVATLDLKEGVRDADLVVLCAPVPTIVDNLRAIAPHLKKGAVVIDVGSSKAAILASAKKHLKRNKFVGCHPMAGSEKCGIGSADARLFEGAICFMTSRDAGVECFWKTLGARPVFLGADHHDAWVAKASHMPHLASFALLSLMGRLPAEVLKSVAGALNPSLAPLVRLAKSDPALWSGILLSNAPHVDRALGEFSAALASARTAVRRGDGGALRRLIVLSNANAARLLPDEA